MNLSYANRRRRRRRLRNGMLQTPRKLYRLHHKGSHTLYSPDTGLQSQLILSGDLRDYHLRTLSKEFIKHFERHCNNLPVATTFISTTSNPHIILERTRRAMDTRREGVVIFEIIPRMSDRDMVVCDATWLAKRIRESGKTRGEDVIDYENWPYLKDEWVVVNEIPKAAIVREWTPAEFERAHDRHYFRRGIPHPETLNPNPKPRQPTSAISYRSISEIQQYAYNASSKSRLEFNSGMNMSAFNPNPGAKSQAIGLLKEDAKETQSRPLPIALPKETQPQLLGRPIIVNELQSNNVTPIHQLGGSESQTLPQNDDHAGGKLEDKDEDDYGYGNDLNYNDWDAMNTNLESEIDTDPHPDISNLNERTPATRVIFNNHNDHVPSGFNHQTNIRNEDRIHNDHQDLKEEEKYDSDIEYDDWDGMHAVMEADDNDSDFEYGDWDGRDTAMEADLDNYDDSHFNHVEISQSKQQVTEILGGSGSHNKNSTSASVTQAETQVNNHNDHVPCGDFNYEHEFDKHDCGIEWDDWDIDWDDIDDDDDDIDADIEAYDAIFNTLEQKQPQQLTQPMSSSQDPQISQLTISSHGDITGSIMHQLSGNTYTTARNGGGVTPQARQSVGTYAFPRSGARALTDQNSNAITPTMSASLGRRRILPWARPTGTGTTSSYSSRPPQAYTSSYTPSSRLPLRPAHVQYYSSPRAPVPVFRGQGTWPYPVPARPPNSNTTHQQRRRSRHSRLLPVSFTGVGRRPVGSDSNNNNTTTYHQYQYHVIPAPHKSLGWRSYASELSSDSGGDNE